MLSVCGLTCSSIIWAARRRHLEDHGVGMIDPPMSDFVVSVVGMLRAPHVASGTNGKQRAESRAQRAAEQRAENSRAEHAAHTTR